MPDTLPTIPILQKMGLVPPKGARKPTLKEQQLYDAAVLQQQQADPAWKEMARGGIDVGANVAKGLMGIDPAENESNAGYAANALTQIGDAASPFLGALKAGLPLMAIRKGKPVFHGTPKPFTHFEPGRNDKKDVLGWLTHAAADPDYAEDYATAAIKHGHIPETERKPNIFALKPDAQNTLDLVEPNADDLSAALAGMLPEKRQRYIRMFKNARRNPVVTRGRLNRQHYPEAGKIPLEQVPVTDLAEQIRLDSPDFNRTQFDAIRYHDMARESFAFPEGTPLYTPWGTPVNNPGTPLTVTRLPESYQGSGNLPVLAEDRWKHTPLNIPDTPVPQIGSPEYEAMLQSQDYLENELNKELATLHNMNQSSEVTELEYQTQKQKTKEINAKLVEMKKANAPINKPTPMPWEEADVLDDVLDVFPGKPHPTEPDLVWNPVTNSYTSGAQLSKDWEQDILSTIPMNKIEVSPEQMMQDFDKWEMDKLLDEVDEAYFGPDLGILSKQDAAAMVQSGELSMSKYAKAFPSSLE